MNKTFFIRSEKELLSFLEDELKGVFEMHSRIAIKLHMGEPGNKSFIPASFTKGIVLALKNIGATPFLFDSPVTYRSARNNVEGYLKVSEEHGYSEANVGAPIVISNESVRVQGKNMDYEVCKELVDADGVLILSHVKGHIASGFGGAIKNLGMGAMSKETKAAIHEGGEPVYTEGCIQCGACVENCPTGNIVLKGTRPTFGKTWCSGCSNCVLVCPEGAIKPKLEVFDELLAEAASKAYYLFKKSYSINFIKNITKLCDCMPKPGPILVEDIGFVCSRNPLAADSASLALIKEHKGVDDIFAEANKKSSYEQINRAANYFKEEADFEMERID